MRTILMNRSAAENKVMPRTLSRSAVMNVAIISAAIGFVMMANAPEDSLLVPMIGCGLILIGAAVSVKNRKGGAR